MPGTGWSRDDGFGFFSELVFNSQVICVTDATPCALMLCVFTFVVISRSTLKDLNISFSMKEQKNTLGG